MAKRKRRKKARKADPDPPPELARDALELLLDEVALSGLGQVAPRPSDSTKYAPDDPLDALDAVRVERAERVPFEGYVRTWRDDRVVRALGHDLSESGIYLAAMGSPIAEQGEELNLELPLPDGDEPIWMTGRVVRCEVRHGFFAVAVAFANLPRSDLERIHAYIEARAHLV